MKIFVGYVKADVLSRPDQPLFECDECGSLSLGEYPCSLCKRLETHEAVLAKSVRVPDRGWVTRA